MSPLAGPSGHVFLRQGKRGSRWYAKFRHPSGRQVQKLLGPAWEERGRAPAGYFTERSAEAALREILVDVARGEVPERPREGAPTMADAVEAWLRNREREKAIKPSTLKDYRRTAYSRILPLLGADTPVAEVGENILAAYKAERLDQVSRRTVQKEMVMLHGIFEVSRRTKKWIRVNPAADLDRLRVQDSGDFNVLEPEQVYAVSRAADESIDRALILVAAFTGLRMGELRALRWSAVRFDLAALHVRQSFSAGSLTTPKSGKVRTVPLMDDTARVLDELSRRDDFTGADDLVFPSPMGSYRHDTHIRDAFYGALRAAGLGHLREKENPFWFHDLRHTFGTIAVRVWPVPEVQLYMGHANIATTMKYVHYQPRHTAAAEFTEAVRAMASVDPQASAAASA